MNRVLGTGELVDLIFEHVVLADAEDRRPRRSRRMYFNGELTASNDSDYIPPPDSTLPALARVCQFFHPSATRIIWRRLLSLKPLLHCLPERMRHEAKKDDEDDEEDEKEAVSSRPVKKNLILPSHVCEEDLVRMKIHGRLVREIDAIRCRSHDYFEAYRSFAVDNDIYDQLLEILPPNTQLLPNLKVASLSISEFSGTSAYPRLVLGQGGPLLSVKTSGNLSSYRTDDQLGPIAENWGDVIRSSELHGVRSFVASFTVDSMLDLVTAFPFKTLGQMIGTQRLTELDLSSFTFDDPMFVWEIASIRNLRTLKLNLCGINNLVKLPSIQQSRIDYFPSLEDVTLITTLSQPLCDLLLFTRPPVLQDLFIKRQDAVDFWDFDVLAKALTASLSPTALKDLTINNNTELNDSCCFGWLTSHITSSTLFHFSPFTELTSLALRVGNSVKLDDKELSAVQHYWPRLTTLQLYDREVSAVSTITPCGVMALLDNLPGLDGLALRFNALKRSSYPATQDIRPHPNLRWWDVCTSDADDVQTVYDFANALCPNLESLTFGWLYMAFWDYDAAFSLSYASEVDEERAARSQEVWTKVNEMLVESRPGFEVWPINFD